MLTVGRQSEERDQVFFGMGDLSSFWGNCIDNRPQMAAVGSGVHVNSSCSWQAGDIHTGTPVFSLWLVYIQPLFNGSKIPSLCSPIVDRDFWIFKIPTRWQLLTNRINVNSNDIELKLSFRV